MSTVLVVEDDPAIIRGLADNLQYEGYEVLQAPDAETGYALLQRARKPDLIVLDLMLPRMSGLELCRRLRDDGRPHADPDADREERRVRPRRSAWISAPTTTSRSRSRCGS